VPPKFALRAPTSTRCSACNPDGIIGNADDVGARISQRESWVPVLFRTAAGVSTSYAIDAKGTASLVGVEGFTVTGDLAARVNTHRRCCR
jgi:hypothetical protein